MDLLQQYSNDSDDERGEQEVKTISTAQRVNTAPDVAARSSTNTLLLSSSSLSSSSANNALAIIQGQNGNGAAGQQLTLYNADRLLHNPKYEHLYAPIAGPYNPKRDVTSQQWASGSKNAVSGQLEGSTITGYVEEYHLNDRLFDDEHRQYYRPTTSSHQRRELKRSRKRRQDGDGNKADEYVVEEDESVINAFGAEAFVVDDEDEHDVDLVARKRELERMLLEQERQEQERKRSRVERETLPEETSIFHLNRERDYQGRSFIVPPSHLKPVHYKEVRSKLPSSCVHTWTGHSKGVNTIEFFPTYGHLLLSSSNDGTIKIWDVLDHRQCIRTYTAHRSAVKRAKFDADGKRFGSCSFDNTVKIWDTETGKVINSIYNGKVPNCVAFCPDPSKGNEVLAGYGNKKVIQWDIRSNEIIQEYDRHLGAVNTITFLNDGKQFVSSSDDKTLRVWDYGIAVEVKYIADPSMHAIPATAISPSNRWMLAQSLDNQIFVYETMPRFRQHKKKHFKGHLINSYACQVDFSNDGQIVLSGDSTGQIWFWRWNTCKKITSIQAHDGVCIGAQWHPILPSTIATCGLDGTIKLFS